MRVCGVVAEFNPFHNGHAALLKAARDAGASHILAVMSGNFVQRGDFAIAPKWVRARSALLCGADLVIELPLPAATAGAQRFALGAVGLLHATGCVDTLLFGSECGDAGRLAELAQAVDQPEVRQALRGLLGEGMTFAKARRLAVEQVYGSPAALLLDQPNNALAAEYLRAAAGLGWSPEVFTIPRLGAAHDAPCPDGGFASASYLRRHALDWPALQAHLPAASLRELRRAHAAGRYPAGAQTMEKAVLAHLRRMKPEAFAMLPDVSEGLHNRMYRMVRRAESLPELESLLKTKRYTLARIRRLVLAAFLGVTETDAALPPPYIRVLGFTDGGRELVSQMKRTAILPVSSRLSRLREQGEAGRRFALLEERAGDLYALALPKPPPCGWEYTESGIYLKGG